MAVAIAELERRLRAELDRGEVGLARYLALADMTADAGGHDRAALREAARVRLGHAFSIGPASPPR